MHTFPELYEDFHQDFVVLRVPVHARVGINENRMSRVTLRVSLLDPNSAKYEKGLQLCTASNEAL